MKNLYIKKIIAVIACAVLASLFVVTLYFGTPDIAAVPRAEDGAVYTVNSVGDDETGAAERVAAEIGKDFTAIRISDLGRLKKITEVNYVADKFVNTNSLSPDIRIVDLTKPFDFAERGTLIFVILNLDPWAEDFHDRANSLEQYKAGDTWNFTLSLPKIFCASVVYRKTALVARHGEIANYEFIDFTTSYDKKTNSYSAQTEDTTIDLSFYTKRTTMEDAFNAAQVITVHYQSTGSAYSGIMDAPLIGTEDEVKSINENSDDLLIAFAILSAVVLAVLIVLSLLKHTKDFVPTAVWVLGITILLLSRFFLAQATSVPLMWVAFWLASSFISLAGALSAMCKNTGKAPLKHIFTSLAVVGAAIAFVCPFASFEAAYALKIVYTVIKAICTAALLVFIALSTVRKNAEDGILKLICTEIIAVALCASLFMPQVFPSGVNPIFWLCAMIIAMTFVSVFMVFRETEKANEYLTANLHKEVERQVNDIKSVISERDKLLQFVSHDMKKPLVTAVTLSDTAIEREKDGEQIKTLQIIKQSCARVVSNLSEIAAYAKFNYLAEPSQIVNLSELCALLFKYHKLDCDANGIILKNTVGTAVKAFAKKQGLENVISNLIINAVEHANCKSITLSVKPDKNKVVLCVADDGKGIADDIDVFAPYVSENDTDTGGVGLYICKNIIESMNGELAYDSKNGGTVFYITLLKA